MVMETIQIRLTSEQIEVLQSLVASGIYPSKSEAVRDAVRKYIRAWELGVPEGIETAEKKVEEEFVKAIEEEAKEYQSVKGTVDFYPEEKAMRDALFNVLRNTAKKFNFREIESPAFETLELLTTKSGEEIKTQIFTLEKRSTEQLGLRFDFTIPAARMFVQKQKELPKPVKWFVIDKAWRYEAPQKGRLREFYQFSCELFGSDKPEADAEVIRMAIELYKSIGLTASDFYVRLNNRKLLVSLLSTIPQEKINSVLRVVDKVEKLSEREFSEELKKLTLNDKQINTIKNITLLKGKPDEIIKKIPLDSEDAKTAVDEVLKIIDGLAGYEDFITLDLSLVRGQDYYTGTIFEFFDREEKYRAIGGGGRYDNLIELFKGEPTPATGFGIGLVPTMLLLEEKGLLPKQELGPDYFVAYFPDVKKEAFELIAKLRKNNIVETDLMQRNFGKQMNYANTIKAKKLIVIGENEIKDRIIKVKDMTTGKEVSKKWEELQ